MTGVRYPFISHQARTTEASSALRMAAADGQHHVLEWVVEGLEVGIDLGGGHGTPSRDVTRLERLPRVEAHHRHLVARGIEAEAT